MALAHVQTHNGYEEWVIVSDEPTDFHTFHKYGFRFDLEEKFLDDKSVGFQIESSEIRNAAMLSRLELILVTNTLNLVSTGTAVVHWGLRCCVDIYWNRGLSYFSIDWRCIEHALTISMLLSPRFWLEPGLDPYPVYASKKQASSPFATLLDLRLEIY